MSTKKPSAHILLHGAFENSFLKLLKEQKVKEAFVLEARPSLEGAKELCPRLLKNNIKPVLIADNMAGLLFFKGYIKEVWISFQEDKDESLLCPIGSLILSVLAKRHGVLVKAFFSSKKQKGQGDPKSIFYFEGKRVAAKGIKGFVPLLEEVSKKYLTEIFC